METAVQRQLDGVVVGFECRDAGVSSGVVKVRVDGAEAGRSNRASC